MKGLVGDALLDAVCQLATVAPSVVVSGDAARCLWMLETLGRDTGLWKRICHPWPTHVSALSVGAPDTPIPLDCVSRDISPIVREFGPAMVAGASRLRLPVVDTAVSVVGPAFILAEIVMEDDPLKVTRIADLLRCLERGQMEIDLEDVRVLLKAVRAGHLYDLLTSVASVI